MPGIRNAQSDMITQATERLTVSRHTRISPRCNHSTDVFFFLLTVTEKIALEGMEVVGVVSGALAIVDLCIRFVASWPT